MVTRRVFSNLGKIGVCSTNDQTTGRDRYAPGGQWSTWRRNRRFTPVHWQAFIPHPLLSSNHGDIKMKLCSGCRMPSQLLRFQTLAGYLPNFKINILDFSGQPKLRTVIKRVLNDDGGGWFVMYNNHALKQTPIAGGHFPLFPNTFHNMTTHLVKKIIQLSSSLLYWLSIWLPYVVNLIWRWGLGCKCISRFKAVHLRMFCNPISNV